MRGWELNYKVLLFHTKNIFIISEKVNPALCFLESPSSFGFLILCGETGRSSVIRTTGESNRKKMKARMAMEELRLIYISQSLFFSFFS